MGSDLSFRFDPRTAAGRVLRLPLTMVPRTQVMRIRRGSTKGMKWVVGSGIHGCWLGTYEAGKQAVLERYILPGMAIYDIGANSGFYTLLFSRLVKEEGAVYAFEPFPENAHSLLTHVRINRLTNTSVVQAAVGPQSRLEGFTVGEGVYQNRVVSAERARLLVPQLRLDEFCAMDHVRAPHLLKIDVEGAEYGVLAGACGLLTRYRPIVFLALHGREPQRLCTQVLTDCGYDIFRLDGTAADGDAELDEVFALPHKR